MPGGFDEVTPAGRQLCVAWRARGGGRGADGGITTLTVDMIVNATGPDYALNRSADPLLVSLRTAGLVSADRLNLGLRTARFGACVDAQGRSSENLYYLGPMLRADYWDATAATELRDHAEQLAAHLAGHPHRAEHGASRRARASRGAPDYASFSNPVSKRSNSARVLYMETPVRSSPPRSAKPSTSTGRAA